MEWFIPVEHIETAAHLVGSGRYKTVLVVCCLCGEISTISTPVNPHRAITLDEIVLDDNFNIRKPR